MNGVIAFLIGLVGSIVFVHFTYKLVGYLYTTVIHSDWYYNRYEKRNFILKTYKTMDFQNNECDVFDIYVKGGSSGEFRPLRSHHANTHKEAVLLIKRLIKFDERLRNNDLLQRVPTVLDIDEWLN